MDLVADHQLRIISEIALPLDLANLPDKHGRIQDDAISNETLLLFVKNARGHEMKDEFLIFQKDGVAGIIAP